MTYQIISAGWGGYRIAVRDSHGALVAEGFVGTKREAKAWIAADRKRRKQ